MYLFYIQSLFVFLQIEEMRPCKLPLAVWCLNEYVMAFLQKNKKGLEYIMTSQALFAEQCKKIK